MKKLKFVVFQSILAGFLASQAIAEEKILTADIQNDLLRASLGAKSKDPSVANKVINESDLEIANKKLMAAEARLLERANIPAEAINPMLPTNNISDVAEAKKAELPIKVEEKNINPPSAPLDINKVIAAIDRTEPDTFQAQPATSAPQAPVAAIVPGAAPPAAAVSLSETEKELAAAIEKNNQLIKELDETRNRLMIAETQVERLSSIIESSGRTKGTAGQEGQDATAALSMSRSKPIQRQESDSDMESDMQIAVVTADKVHLRTGPGKENSPLMAVTRGTRLAVETKNGEWYRVIAPTGARAWVSQDVISFSTADKIKSGNQIVGFSG